MGIAKKDLENIFKPFKMKHLRKVSGNGVGLSICKQICEQMDGSFYVKSELGIGSTFSFAMKVFVVEENYMTRLREEKSVEEEHELAASPL